MRSAGRTEGAFPKEAHLFDAFQDASDGNLGRLLRHTHNLQNSLFVYFSGPSAADRLEKASTGEHSATPNDNSIDFCKRHYSKFEAFIKVSFAFGTQEALRMDSFGGSIFEHISTSIFNSNHTAVWDRIWVYSLWFIVLSRAL